MATAAVENGGGNGARITWDAEPHPWRRYGARSIDILVFSSIFTLFATIAGLLIWPPFAHFLTAPPLWASFLILTPLGVAVTGIGVAVCHARWGSTAGKWMFRLKVRNAQGGRLTFGQALAREVRVAFWGLAFGLPFVSLLMLALSHSDLDNDGATRWDRAVSAQSTGQVIKGSAYVWLVAGVLVVIAGKLLGIIGLAMR
jgi:uncharacterized RDD family membrane protein YckC